MRKKRFEGVSYNFLRRVTIEFCSGCWTTGMSRKAGISAKVPPKIARISNRYLEKKMCLVKHS